MNEHDEHEKRPVEEWARAKGHRVILDGAVDPRAPDYWRFAAAKAGKGWPDGKELTEGEYDGAIDGAGKVEVR